MSLFTTALRRLAALCAGAIVALPAWAGDIVEYYHAGLDHYFVTGYAAEIEALDSGKFAGWARTGYTFQVFDAGDPRGANAIPVCRFYGSPERGLDSHFYAATALECEDVQRKFAAEWLLESADFFRVHPVDSNTGLCPANTKPVYRLYNRRADVNHRYTTDVAIVDQMKAKGYVLEGNGSATRPIAFCAANLGTAQPASAAPVCTLTSSTSLPALGVPITLTATCTGSPTTYAWVNCLSGAATCTTNSAFAGTINYSVVATNGSGPSAPATLALNWQVQGQAGQPGQPAGAAPICTVAASTTSPMVGGALTLTGNCSQTPSRYEWLGCSALLIDICNPISECASSKTSCAPVGRQAGSVYYALRASNSAGSSAKSGIAVTWQSGGSSAPPPPSNPTPFCTVSPSSSSPAVNTTLTLTASCTNFPTSFQWSNCASTTNVCTTTESTAVMRTYSVTASNASGVGSPASASIFWQQPPTAPPVCTLSANNPTPYAGGSVTLTANCTQSPTSFNWVGCNSSGSTCQASSANTGSATYSVTASNQFGAGPAASTSVNWQTPPASGADFCGNYPDVVRTDLQWGGGIPFDSRSNGGFKNDTVIVARIRVPANATGSQPGLVSVVEFAGNLVDRTMTISPSACDFRGFVPDSQPSTDPTGARYPMRYAFSQTPNFLFDLVGSAGNNVKLAPGQTYYVNLRNRDYSGRSTCTTGSCDIRMTLNPPR